MNPINHKTHPLKKKKKSNLYLLDLLAHRFLRVGKAECDWCWLLLLPTPPSCQIIATLLNYSLKRAERVCECVFQMSTFDICSQDEWLCSLNSNGTKPLLSPPPLTFLVPVFVTILLLHVNFLSLWSKKVASQDEKSNIIVFNLRFKRG